MKIVQIQMTPPVDTEDVLYHRRLVVLTDTGRLFEASKKPSGEWTVWEEIKLPKAGEATKDT
jgi:hypothetical protein